MDIGLLFNMHRLLHASLISSLGNRQMRLSVSKLSNWHTLDEELVYLFEGLPTALGNAEVSENNAAQSRGAENEALCSK